MKKTRGFVCVLLMLVCLAALFPQVGARAGEAFIMGNSDINIQNGGIMLSSGGDFYYSEDGIRVSSGDSERMLAREDGRNLNLWENYIYYTTQNGDVRRVALNGGEPETVYSHGAEIEQLYLIGGNLLRFISGGRAWEQSLNSGSTKSISSLERIVGLIPTQYGNLYLTGELFDYTLHAEERAVLRHLTGCYTDSGYLAAEIGTGNYQIPLEKLFYGFDPGRDIKPFDIHGSIDTIELFGLEDNTFICPECEANSKLGLSADDGTQNITLMEEGEAVIPPVSQGQRNIVLRARQQSEIKWTPLEDRYQWGYNGIFKAETTYTGIPYGQPVNTGYVPWSVSFSKFISSVNNNTSFFYTTYSEYNQIAPSYSSDCSAYVSSAWGLKSRLTTYSLPSVAQRVSDQSIYSVQVGDCLNHQLSHVVLISGVGYDDQGNIISIEIMEQTPPITKYTKYGEGGTSTLAALQQRYFGGGYVLYRNPERDAVQYSHDCSAPVDGDYCASCKTAVPKTKTTGFIGGKTVHLSHDNENAVIYYTTDGSTPTKQSAQYSEPLTFYSASKLRAIAVTSDFSGSEILEYTVKVPQAAAPAASVGGGMSAGLLVSKGSSVTLKSSSAGAAIRYTLDGTLPTESSPVYSAPIVINADTTIKAYAEAPGMSSSETAEFTYKTGNVYKITVSAGAGGSSNPTGSVNVLETTGAVFKFTPDSGYAVSDVKIDGVSVGAVTSYEFSNVSGDHSVSVTFKEINILPFTDVAETDWYYPAVGRVYKMGYFSGTSSTAFSPDGVMTRAMFVTVLGRMAGVSDSLGISVGIVMGDGVRIRSGASTESEVLGSCGKNTAVKVLAVNGDWHNIQHGAITGYIRNDLIKSSGADWEDVSAGQYYTSYAKWAGLTGIVNGTSNTSFSPNSNVTREQVCVMLYNYAQKYGMSLPEQYAGAVFTDNALISSWAADAVYAMQKAGVVSGMGDGSFNPKASATRAQVSQILINFVDAAK